MKKRNLLLSLLVAGSLVTPVFADDGSSTGDVYITKTLQMPKGTELADEISEITFNFEFEPSKFNGADCSGGDKTRGFTTFVVPVEIATNSLDTPENSDVTSASKSESIKNRLKLTSVGIYEYTVTELSDYTITSTQDNSELTNLPGEMEYSEASYTMTVYVANDDDGVKIDNITVKKTKEDNGSPITSSGTNNQGKVDAGDGTDSLKADFNFVNTYTENSGTDPKDPNNPTTEELAKSSLELTKTVTTTESKENGEKYVDFEKGFTFEVDVTANKLNPLDNEIYAYTKSGETITKIIDTLEDPDSCKYTFTLKHGDSFYISALPVGSLVTVKESGTPNYTPSVTYTLGNDDSVTNTNFKKDGDLQLDNLEIKKNSKSDLVQNTFAVTNTFDDSGTVSPTGIIINNLPYILLVVVGVAGIALYEAGRRRFNN